MLPPAPLRSAPVTAAAPGAVPLDLDRGWTYGPDVQHGGRLLERVAAAVGAVDAVDTPSP